MKKSLFLFCWILSIQSYAQRTAGPEVPVTVKKVECTPVKYQAKTNTCWSYSTTSMVESECLRNTGKTFDLSEMFTARSLFIEKGKRFIESGGKTLFEAGGLGHDAIYGIVNYGAIPEEFYPSQKALRASDASGDQLEHILRRYLVNCLTDKSQMENGIWMGHYIFILDSALGVPPGSFMYEGKEYTPLTFTSEVLKVRTEDYVTITSFTHHPYNKNFALEIPDNYLFQGDYFNVPIQQMIAIAENAINKNYSIVVDMDVSNNGWNCRKLGFAMNLAKRPGYIENGDIPEDSANQEIRQRLFDAGVTKDDHLLHMMGTARSAGGKRFFILKDSGGENYGPFHGFDYVSENYFIINCLSIMLPKAALSAEMQKMIGI